jgi:hypothetical protein
MAKPTFIVNQAIACLAVGWEGPAGPRTLRTLEGIGYTRETPPGSEYPEIDLWLYLRLFRTNNETVARRIRIDVFWLDAPGGERWIFTYPHGRVQFGSDTAVLETALHLGTIPFQGRGRYEFRIVCKRKRRWQDATEEVVVGSEYLRIE